MSVGPFIDNPSIDGVKANGRVKMVYIVFRKGAKAAETLRIGPVYHEGLEAVVDVNHRDIPVALQFLVSAPADRTVPTGGREEPAEELFQWLFLEARDMVKRYRNQDSSVEECWGRVVPNLPRQLVYA